ncbi:hypothetical protein ElyMa_004075100 [Elysia marginata]|uniref:Uncharacterized protein n=1 Tax=Elysia marginata TaxID=1093978 RepID=A0AAV4G8S9_9GAST|nr:hypothetical protein ElyMa_004075100 [Elysia marginata]
MTPSLKQPPFHLVMAQGDVRHAEALQFPDLYKDNSSVHQGCSNPCARLTSIAAATEEVDSTSITQSAKSSIALSTRRRWIQHNVAASNARYCFPV